MNKLTRFLAIGVITFAFSISAKAQNFRSFITAATVATNVLSGGKYVITDIIVQNTNATSGAIWFYDSASSSTTNQIQAATESISNVSTNWTQVFTNATGIVITNTFTGLSHVSSSVVLQTNELPRIRPMLLTASGTANATRTLSDLNIQPTRGLTAYSTVGTIVELVYRKTEP